MSIKSIIKSTKLHRWLKNKGLLNKEVRRFLLLNFIFQRIFGLNRECPWSVNFTSTLIESKKIKIGKSV